MQAKDWNRIYGIISALLTAFIFQAANICMNHTFLKYPTLELALDSVLIRGKKFNFFTFPGYNICMMQRRALENNCKTKDIVIYSLVKYATHRIVEKKQMTAAN